MEKSLKIIFVFISISLISWYVIDHYSVSNKIEYRTETLKHEVTSRLVDSNKKCIVFNEGKRRYFANDDFENSDYFQARFYLNEKQEKCYTEIIRNNISIIKTKNNTCMDFNHVPKTLLGYKPNNEPILIDDQCY